jgi:hypothetical protein
MTISFIDPPSVRHLGELASLKSAILSHFHQDSGLYYPSDEQRWRAILNHYSAAERDLIAGQIRELLSRDDPFVVRFWDRHSDYFWFETAADVRAYLKSKLALFG